MSRILYIAQEPELREGSVVTGNALRARQLIDALQQAGHEVRQVWLVRPGEPRDAARGFRHRDDLQARIAQFRPDVLVVAYWELLGLLPFDIEQPVVLDFVAPRPLETLYEAPAESSGEIRRLCHALRRCDLVLVGNESQGRLLTLPLIEAGFDLRDWSPVRVVPLGAAAVPSEREPPGGRSWRVVGGGVRWPWRHQSRWLEALADGLADAGVDGQVIHFEGPYRGHPEAPFAGDAPHSPDHSLIDHRPLLPYREYSEFLSREAHIGFELSDRNIEREYSQSFRSLDFLRHGLPLLCNDFLPLARLVEHYDAGWTVGRPDDLAEWARSLRDGVDSWKRKAANAERLAREALDPGRLAAPLIEWLNDLQPAPRLPSPERHPVEPVLGIPPLRQRLARQVRLGRRALLLRLTGLRRPGDGIVLVTRSDLFPPDHGAAVRTVETARALGELGMDVAIVTDDRRHWYRYREGEFTVCRYPGWARLTSLPASLVKLLHHSKDLPHSNSFLYLPLTDRSFYRRTLIAASAVRASVLQAEFPAYAEPCLRVREAVGTPVVLVEHNVEYERLRNQIGELTVAQYERLRAIEIDLCNRSDAVVCVSDNDRQRLIEDGVEPGHLSTIPHGVRLDNYAASAADGVREGFGIPVNEPVLAFHGTFSYPPNRHALGVFADTLLPSLERSGVTAHVLAVGREPPPTSPHPRIHFTGSVTDVAPWLKVADLAVIPLTDGGGTRMKIVDCFAAGLPVISTSKGIEGIPVEPGRHALVIDDWDAMTAAIVRLWSDPSEREDLARSGREFAAGLDWTAIGRRYRALYASLS